VGDDHPLDDDGSTIACLVGHPRRVLAVGHGTSAVAAREGTAVVELGADGDPAAAVAGGVRFDLLVLAGADLARAADPDALLRRLLPALDDEARVIVSIPAGPRPSRSAIEVLERCGLEVMTVHSADLRTRARNLGRRIVFPQGIVARRPAVVRRELSLTVGMISMNEAGAVERVIDDIRQHAPKAEVLLVDSSKDETPALAEAKGARVVRQFPPRGYGRAMHRLLYEAQTNAIVTLDCDGTYPADRILPMLRLLEEGADLVNATRTRRRPEAMPFPNFLANRVFAATANVVHGTPTTDVHSGMRAYRTSMLRGIDVDPSGPALPVDLLVAPARLGYRIVEIEIPYFERVGNSSLQRWDSTVWTFRRLFRAQTGRRARRERFENR